jgi:hypothetical protein
MLTKVMLYTIEDENSMLECEGPMGCYKGDTFADLKVRLEATGVINWPFQFWDQARQCRIKSKMELLNPMANNMHVIKNCGLGFEPIKRTFDKAFGDNVPKALGTSVLHEEDVPPPVNSDILGLHSRTKRVRQKSTYLSLICNPCWCQKKLSRSTKHATLDEEGAPTYFSGRSHLVLIVV